MQHLAQQHFPPARRRENFPSRDASCKTRKNDFNDQQKIFSEGSRRTFFQGMKVRHAAPCRARPYSTEAVGEVSQRRFCLQSKKNDFNDRPKVFF
jgi:hypothetical protein